MGSMDALPLRPGPLVACGWGLGASNLPPTTPPHLELFEEARATQNGIVAWQPAAHASAEGGHLSQGHMRCVGALGAFSGSVKREDARTTALP